MWGSISSFYEWIIYRKVPSFHCRPRQSHNGWKWKTNLKTCSWPAEHSPDNVLWEMYRCSASMIYALHSYCCQDNSSGLKSRHSPPSGLNSPQSDRKTEEWHAHLLGTESLSPSFVLLTMDSFPGGSGAVDITLLRHLWSYHVHRNRKDARVSLFYFLYCNITETFP